MNSKHCVEGRVVFQHGVEGLVREREDVSIAATVRRHCHRRRVVAEVQLRHLVRIGSISGDDSRPFEEKKVMVKLPTRGSTAENKNLPPS